MKTTILLFLCLCLPHRSATAGVINSIHNHLYNRQKIKEARRWSLVGAFSENSQSDLFAQFLTSNPEASIFEFQIYASGGAYQLKPKSVEVDQAEGSVFSYGGFAYFWIFGFERDVFDLDASRVTKNRIHFRVLGDSEQNTHFSVFYGQRFNESLVALGDEFENKLYGLDLQLYLQNQIGVSALFEVLKKSSDDDFQQLSGTTVTWEAFVELGAYRLFAQWIQQKHRGSSQRSLNFESHRFIQRYGLKFFF